MPSENTGKFNSLKSHEKYTLTRFMDDNKELIDGKMTPLELLKFCSDNMIFKLTPSNILTATKVNNFILKREKRVLTGKRSTVAELKVTIDGLIETVATLQDEVTILRGEVKLYGGNPTSPRSPSNLKAWEA